MLTVDEAYSKLRLADFRREESWPLPWIQIEPMELDEKGHWMSQLKWTRGLPASEMDSLGTHFMSI